MRRIVSGVDARLRGGRLGRERPRQLAHGVDPVGQLGEPAGLGQALLEQHVDEREQQVRVGAGPDRVVLVGGLGGAAAARVDDDELAAARLQRLQPAAHVGRGHQRAVRRERVGAEHQQVLRAVDVGDRDRQRRAVHQRVGDLLRPLVDRAGGEDAARAERLQQHAAVEQRREPVRRGVADVDADRVAAVRAPSAARAARR